MIALALLGLSLTNFFQGWKAQQTSATGMIPVSVSDYELVKVATDLTSNVSNNFNVLITNNSNDEVSDNGSDQKGEDMVEEIQETLEETNEEKAEDNEEKVEANEEKVEDYEEATQETTEEKQMTEDFEALFTPDENEDAVKTSDNHNSGNGNGNSEEEKSQNTRFGFPVLPMVELDDNHVTLRGEINSLMVSKAMVEMGQLGNDSDEILLYISSPGGSIAAGNSFIQYMNYLRMKGKTITCVADIAASMAFSIFQECDNRYVTPSSILMQHQMAVGLKDQYENLKNYLKLLEAMNEDYLYRESARIGLTYEQFKAKILSDWWLFGEQNVDSNVADAVVYVGCSQELLEGERIEKYKYRGEYFEVVYSKCPLSRAPLRVQEDKDQKKGRGKGRGNSDSDDHDDCDHFNGVCKAGLERKENTERTEAEINALAHELMISIVKSMIISLEKKDVKCSL